jgi:DNA repair protein RecO (recombination protein O)
MIIRTEALVLRSMDYRETSRIVTLFTRERGKITVLARGARQSKSRFGSTLQPLTYTQVVFYYKTTRSLQTLTESSHMELFSALGQDLEKLTIGLRLLELTGALMQEEQENAAAFNLLLEALRRLDTTPVHQANLLPYFQLRLAATLGFAPAIDREAVQHLPDDGGLLALDQGAVLPPGARPEHVLRASRAALRAYAICARADLETVMRMRLTAPVRRELERLVEAYLRFHVEDAYPTRSEKVIEQMSRPR